MKFYDTDICVYAGIIAEYALIRMIALESRKDEIKMAYPHEMARWVGRLESNQ